VNQNLLRALFDYHLDGYFIARTKRALGRPKGEIVRGSGREGYYAYLQIGRKKILFHRAIFLWHCGFLPEEIDHIDRDKENNRIENLRAATKSQNRGNIPAYKNNSSGKKGVIARPNGRFTATIKYKKQRFYLGTFKTALEASEVYNAKAKELLGNFAFPGL
jgi:hypothetical protein